MPNALSPPNPANILTDPDTEETVYSDTVLLSGAPDATHQQVIDAIGAAGGTVAGRLPGSHLWQARIPPVASMVSLTAAAEEFSEQPGVAAVEVDREVRPASGFDPNAGPVVPTDPDYQHQWYSRATKVDQAWAIKDPPQVSTRDVGCGGWRCRLRSWEGSSRR